MSGRIIVNRLPRRPSIYDWEKRAFNLMKKYKISITKKYDSYDELMEKWVFSDVVEFYNLLEKLENILAERFCVIVTAGIRDMKLLVVDENWKEPENLEDELDDAVSTLSVLLRMEEDEHKSFEEIINSMKEKVMEVDRQLAETLEILNKLSEIAKGIPKTNLDLFCTTTVSDRTEVVRGDRSE